MLVQNVEYLLERSQEVLLRPKSRVVDLPVSGRQSVEAYALVWDWYDLILAYPYGNDQDRLFHFWERCIAEEGLSPADALVRLVFEIVEGYDAGGVEIADHNLALDIAKERLANWRAGRAQS